MMKLKDRVAIVLALMLISLTVLLVVDIQMELGWTGNYRIHEMAYQRNRLCGSVGYDTALSVRSTSTEKPVKLLQKLAVNDRFKDLMQSVYEPEKFENTKNLAKIIIDDSDDNFETLHLFNVTHMNIDVNSTILHQFHGQITNRAMYSEQSDDVVQQLMHEMAKRGIDLVQQMSGGTQLKLVITYDNKMQALFKPMRFDRKQQTLPNHFYFTDFERHNAEIAAFHLDRLLGFRRAVPVTGRLLNISTEIYELTDHELLHTAFQSPAGNLCFHGKCSYYCDTSHAICGHPDTLEGSFAAFLPDKEIRERKLWKHPWRRSYSKRKRAEWERAEDDYCTMVRQMAPYDKGRRLLDLIDMAVFDFLMGNMDRHHYETFLAFGNETFTIHLDHGRSFGKPFHDEVSILAPLLQCCEIRASTLKTLLQYHNGPTSLAEAMHKAMLDDPVAPILWTPHLTALNRRIAIILSGVRECIEKNNSMSSSSQRLSSHSFAGSQSEADN